MTDTVHISFDGGKAAHLETLPETLHAKGLPAALSGAWVLCSVGLERACKGDL